MTDLIEVQTSALAAAALDWAVARVEGIEVAIAEPHYGTDWRIYRPESGGKYSPSMDWAVGGPLIRSHRMGFGIYPDGFFACVGLDDLSGSASGPSHLIAACRAIVAAKLGDTVQVPKELIQ